jgi:hypothetical protein
MSEPVFAEIRCMRPIICGTESMKKGDVYCQVKFPSVERLEHFRRNLRWSAFQVVKIDGRAAKGNVKDARDKAIKELMKIDGIGESIATHLHDEMKIITVHDLVATISTAPQKLISADLNITDQTIEHWQRQLGC